MGVGGEACASSAVAPPLLDRLLKGKKKTKREGKKCFFGGPCEPFPALDAVGVKRQ